MIKSNKISKAKAADLLALTEKLPTNPVDFFRVSTLTPPKVSTTPIKVAAKTLREVKTTQSVAEDSLVDGFNKDFLTTLVETTPFPILKRFSYPIYPLLCRKYLFFYDQFRTTYRDNDLTRQIS